MTTSLNRAAQCYGLYEGGSIIGICAILYQPRRDRRPSVRVSRLVILPDYQGIGLGTRFLDAVCGIYSDGNIVSIVTSAKNMIHALRKSDVWEERYYRVHSNSGKTAKLKTSHRTNMKTASFVYVGHKGY